MVAVCFYFQVHQPFRLRRDFNFFSVGSNEPVEDEMKNREICLKVAEKCYLPTNEMMLRLIDRHKGQFKISYSISGVALEQFEKYTPEVLLSFKRLAATGCVEFIGETYYHSLAFIYSREEFKRQVKLHSQKIFELFGQKPKTFRNTELITNTALAHCVEEMGFETLLAEGADHILQWRSPNYVYTPRGCQKSRLLLKNYRLSDDIAFRFSNQGWAEWPLTAEKFASWIHQVPGNGYVVNLFMDYETFGEHQWESTGIFKFFTALPNALFQHSDISFKTPCEVTKAIPSSGEIDFPSFVSWADTERDTSAWLGNPLQDSSIETLYAMENDVLSTQNEEIIAQWRKLQTSDHFYYMCIKWFQDGDVHKYFSPYNSPYDAFLFYSNALHQVHFLTQKALTVRQGTAAQHVLGKIQNTSEQRVKAPRKKKTATAPEGTVTLISDIKSKRQKVKSTPHTSLAETRDDVQKSSSSEATLEKKPTRSGKLNLKKPAKERDSTL